MDTYVNELFDSIIYILSDKKYDIGPAAMKRMESRRAAVADFCSENIPETIVLTDENGSEASLYYPTLRGYPQVIDPAPIAVNGKYTVLSPVLVPPAPEENIFMYRWKICHELCHLFSVGGHTALSTGEYEHCFGLNRYRFRLLPDRMSVITVSEHEIHEKNEILNDAVTWHFLERFEGKRINAPDEYTKFHCEVLKERDIERIAGQYFGGDAAVKGSLITELFF